MTNITNLFQFPYVSVFLPVKYEITFSVFMSCICALCLLKLLSPISYNNFFICISHFLFLHYSRSYDNIMWRVPTKFHFVICLEYYFNEEFPVWMNFCYIIAVENLLISLGLFIYFLFKQFRIFPISSSKDIDPGAISTQWW